MKTNLFLFAALVISIMAAHITDDKSVHAKAKQERMVFPRV